MRRVIAVFLVIVVLALVVWALAGGWSPIPTATNPSVPGPAQPGIVEDDADAAAPDIPSTATPATVEYVHDGDTIFLTDGRKVRLLGINTPEIGEDAECWGEQATSELRGLVTEGSAVWVQQDVEALDQYGRSLLFVFLEDGTNVNVEMVRVGAAEIEQYSPNWLYTDELHAAEDAAYAERIGLWGNC